MNTLGECNQKAALLASLSLFGHLGKAWPAIVKDTVETTKFGGKKNKYRPILGNWMGRKCTKMWETERAREHRVQLTTTQSLIQSSAADLVAPNHNSSTVG